jgi:hypothetical protein
MLKRLKQYFSKEEEVKEEDCSWMDNDYLKLEECDNDQCKRMVYTTCNMTCDKCGETNEIVHNAVYHCTECIGQDKKYKDGDGEFTHGFDLCKKCYEEDPTFEMYNHSKDHNFKKMEINEMIHECVICSQYFCYDCTIRSRTPIVIHDYLEMDKSEKVTILICKPCLSHFV